MPWDGFAAPKHVLGPEGFLLFPWHKSRGGSSSGNVHQGGPEEGQEGETHTTSSPGTSSFICNRSGEGKGEGEQTAGSIMRQPVLQPGRSQSVGKELSPSPAGQSFPGCEQVAVTRGGMGVRRSPSVCAGTSRWRKGERQSEGLGLVLRAPGPPPALKATATSLPRATATAAPGAPQVAPRGRYRGTRGRRAGARGISSRRRPGSTSGGGGTAGCCHTRSAGWAWRR